MPTRFGRLWLAQDALQPLHPLEPAGVFDRIFAGLASEGPKPERIMIDATHLRAHRTAASLLKKGMFPVVSGEPRAGWTRSSTQSATVTDGRTSCSCRKARWATTRAPVSCSAPCRRPRISSPIAARTAPGSAGNLEARGIEPCIPSSRSRKIPYAYDTALHRQRRKVENLFAKLKDWRRIATLRPMRPHLLLGHLHRSSRHLLALINESWA